MSYSIKRNRTTNDVTLNDGVGKSVMDNIEVDGNTISSKDTNGNISVVPNGTGKVLNKNIPLSNDGLRIMRGADSSILKITNYIDDFTTNKNYVLVEIPDASNYGAKVRFYLETAISIDLTGATWGLSATKVDVKLYVYAINRGGAIRWGISKTAALNTVGTGFSSTPASVIAVGDILVNDSTSMASGDLCLCVGYIVGDYTTGTNEWVLHNATTDSTTDIFTILVSSGLGSGGSSGSTKEIAQAHTFTVGKVIYFSTTWQLCDNTALGKEGIGIVSEVSDSNNFTVTFSGYISGLAGLTANSYHYASSTGTLRDVNTQYSAPIGFAISTTELIMLPWKPEIPKTFGLATKNDPAQDMKVESGVTNIIPILNSTVTINVNSGGTLMSRTVTGATIYGPGDLVGM